ncbi:neurotrypsin isoform X1 [Mustela putorius furo]|uniref:Neurotrypsin n=1 Tax=Mustela putorius furo TaxID=9669 RepID=M3Z163_MUSPF|nr:neurotrypsin isoform X1 [Mustela putorius furo]
MGRSRDAERKAQRAAGGEMGRGGRSARGGAGRDSSGGFEGRCSPAPAPSSPLLQNRRSRGAWTKPGCSGTMTLACFVVALVLGALPEVIGFDLVVTYPLHHRYRHSPPASPRHPHYLPTQQRPQRTPPPPPVPRVPRPPPAMHAQRLHALHAGRTPGPHHRDCPAGEPWVNVTDFGAPCLRWAEVPPFLERSPPASWAQLRGQRHNFCRSPDGAGRPWCFYGHAHGKVDWGYCDCRHGSVRLRGGKHEFEGTVEIYANGTWGTVCGSHWDDADASVICHQLQLGRKGIAKQTPFSGLGLIPIYWSNVRCRGDEENILLCEKDIWQGGACPQKMAAAVTCSFSQGPTFPAIRLVGGSSAREGRVEVYHAGHWGTVCDDQWDEADAEVICRQLGLSGIAKAWNQAYFGEGSGPIMLDEVRCTGNELSIEQCPKSSWGEHNCDHKEDAGVSCTPLTDGVIRLGGGKGSHEGRLEVYHRGRWGTVCDDGWTELNTYVVCRQLGFKYGKQASANHFEESTGPIWLDDVSCSGKESSLVQCSRRQWGRHDCSHREDVGITCYPGGNGYRLSLGFPIRLMDGENKKEGRVELFINGQWGTICDDGWTDKDATVICRQLGYKGPAKARTMAYFGEGNGPIHVDNVKCTGNERSLADCIKQDIGRHNCRHSEDAGVICDYFSKKATGNSNKESLSSVCGLRLVHHRQKRIIGGKNSLRGGWPWQVSLRLKSSHGDGRLLCGATLLSSCWVLTAAHCFKRYGNSTRNYAVRVGDYHTLVPEEFEEEIGVQQIVIHRGYRPDSSDYDIALVRLEGPEEQCVRFSSHVLPACLPLRRERPQKTASNCYITGWGDTGKAYSRTLQQAAIPLLPKRFCEERYKGRFTGRMLCAGNLQEHKRVDSCQGDSGGPLMCVRSGESWVVYGVTSWGYGCGAKDSPGVYTKVSAFVPWIKSVTKL